MKLKSVFLSVIVFILICFIIPVLFTKKFKVAQADIINENNITEDTYQVNSYDYKQYNKINLLHTLTGEVEEIELDEYLYGVVASEMPATYEKEALKAQTIVARTYTIYKIINGAKHENANICDDSKCCQAWISKEDRYAKWNENERDSNWNKIVEAVNNTKGKVITYEGNVINAFFHANSGGTTETVINVWGRN